MAKQSVASAIASQVAALGLLAAPAAGFSPANPAPTSSTSLVMMGLGSACVITPSNQSPLVLVTVTGVAAVATAVQPLTVGGRYGTGSAPANGAAVTGTRFGPAADPVITPPAAGAGVPFALTALLSLIPGARYWFDLALATGNASDAASLSAVSMTLIELP